MKWFKCIYYWVKECYYRFTKHSNWKYTVKNSSGHVLKLVEIKSSRVRKRNYLCNTSNTQNFFLGTKSFTHPKVYWLWSITGREVAKDRRRGRLREHWGTAARCAVSQICCYLSFYHEQTVCPKWLGQWELQWKRRQVVGDEKTKGNKFKIIFLNYH